MQMTRKPGGHSHNRASRSVLPITCGSPPPRVPAATVCEKRTLLISSKRPFLARGLGLDAYWLPVPRQEFVEAAGGMTVGHALQNVSEPGKGLDVVELCGGDEGTDGCPSNSLIPAKISLFFEIFSLLICVGNSAVKFPHLSVPTLGDDAFVVEILHQVPETFQFQIPLEDISNSLGLGLVDDQLLVLCIIDQRHGAAGPFALASAGRDFVADPFGG